MKTSIADAEMLAAALAKMGHQPVRGPVSIRGFAGATQTVDLKIASGSPGYDIGFASSGETFDVVADWWGIKQFTEEGFKAQLEQTYAYTSAVDRLAAQGFDVADQTTDEKGTIRLVMRRFA